MKKVGKYPADAKIYINYKEKKIGFKYPERRSEFSHLTNLLSWFMGGMLLPFLAGSIIFILVGNLLQIELILSLAMLGVVWFLMYILVIVLYYINKPYFKEKLPLWCSQLNAATMMKYEFTFRRIKTKQIKIPLFSNNILEYKARKDYSKYLKSLKIEPIKAYKYMWGWLRHKKKLQLSKWEAVFEFEKIPKSGSIWVRYI